MNRFVAVALVGLAGLVPCFSGLAEESGMEISSRVDAVTVYPDAARVTRVASARLGAGVSVLRLTGLPEDLETESIQVSGKGSGVARILDVRSVSEFHRESSSERLKALDARILGLKDEKAANIDRMTVLRSSLDYIDSIRKFMTSHPAEGEAAAPLEPEKWLGLISFQERESRRLMEEMRAFSLANRELDEEVDVLNAERRGLTSVREFETKTVLVSVEAAAAMDFELELRYLIGEASWSPVYDVYVDLASSELELIMKAAVQHESVADWKNVQLTLSTAKPSLAGVVPVMRPWRVRRQEAVKRPAPMDSLGGYSGVASNSMVRRGGDDAVFELDAGVSGVGGNFAGAAEFLDAEFEESGAKSTLAATEFVLPYRTDLAAGEDAQRVRVASFKVAAEVYHLAMARVSGTTFLKARAVNTASFPLLAGPTQVFLDGNFVAQSRIDFLAAGAEMNFLLGGSSRVTVKRELVNTLNETVGFGGKQNRQTQEYLYTLTNNDAVEQLLVLRDQIPVSGNEEIVVDLIAPDAKAVELDATGMLIWRLTLAPGEKREVKLAFSVQHPKDWMVSGL